MSSGPPRLGDLSAVKLALMARKIRSEAEPVLRADPIAVVGMGCRIPGGADSPDAFWDLLAQGKDAVREVPPDRWSADAWFDADPAAPGKTAVKCAGFLDRVDGFDADYFGILPREAERMDPQQRLLLEVAMEALDDAGLSRDHLRGARAGVYVASYHNDYALMQFQDVESIDARCLTGTQHSVLANRISHFLDLRGPSLSLDTACSSSLVAIHLACQSLRTGETDVALAGGVSIILGPELMVALSKVGFMAPDGRSKAFDASADGFGRGEGCGVVVLKRLSDAIPDGDRVLALVRGSAVNQDGHSTLLAAPNGLAQRAMLAEALGAAQLDPSRIGFIEAHGTGTALGDPIEVEAIAEIVGQPSSSAGPLWLGAAKANVGHLEAAAGVTGFVKAVLALRKGAIPPQAHFRKLNPYIRLHGTRLEIPTVLTPWPEGTWPRCAGVSSFGIGGTNAHVVLEEAPRLPAGEAAAEVSRVLPLSAQKPEALRALAESWVGFLEQTPASAAALCHTAAERRTHHNVRLAVVGRTKGELQAELRKALGDGSLEAGPARRPAGSAPRVAFVFGGQGPQWHAMGRELLGSEPAFREALTQVDARLAPLAGWSLLEELGRDETTSRLDETRFAQPALFGIQVALAELWKAWGVTPSAVVGHSVGEIAALHVAGALELPEAVRVVFHRARIMQEATGLGRMAQVSLDEAAALTAVQPYGDRLSVAALNGPRTFVLSGEETALDEVLARLEREGVGQRRLSVKYAFHSAQMAPFQARLVEALAGLTAEPPRIPFCSTVTGAMLTERVGAEYFGANVREPVRFASAIGNLAAAGHDVFLELGPHPVLAASIGECLEAAGKSGHVLTSLRRSRPERETMLQACAGLYAAGVDPAWAEVQQAPADVVSLPAYPWQRRRHWIRQRPARAALPAAKEGAHPLLGRSVGVAGVAARVFEGGWAGEPQWIADHRIGARLLLPAAAMLELFQAAAEAALGPSRRIEAFSVERPLVLPEAGEGAARWQVVITDAAPERAHLELHQAEGDAAWQRIASAEAVAAPGEVPAPAPAGALLEALAPDAIYARFEALGANFGPSFRCLDAVRRGERCTEGRIVLDEATRAAGAGHALHPVILDGALQLCWLAAPRDPGGELVTRLVLPVGVDRVRILRPAEEPVRARAAIREAATSGSLTADVTIESEAGEPVAALEGVRLAPAQALTSAEASADPVHAISWHPLPVSAPTEERPPGRWLFLCDRGGAGEALARELSARGASCALATAGAAWARTAANRWAVDPASPADFAKLLVEVGPTAGIVHLLGLDAAPLDPLPSADAEDREQMLATGSLLHLAQALSRAGSAGPLWIVTRGAQAVTGEEPAGTLRPRAAGAWGLASVIAVEEPGLGVRRVELDPSEPAESVAGLARELLTGSAGPASVALRAGTRWAARIERRPTTPDEPLVLEIERAGTLDGLTLRRRPRAALGKDEVRLRVTAAGLNFRDVLLALGMYVGNGIPLGAECAGLVIEAGAAVRDLPVGTRVFGFAPAAFATEVVVPAAFLAPVPQGMRDEDAAGLPIAFLTAWYGLHTLAGLRTGERVLVHAAAGGVGLAAVQLAQRAGAEVIATAGSPAKRELLQQLGVRHVLDSRSLSFADGTRAATGGEGVDVVLNSLAGEFIEASLGVLRKGGRFLELGKRGILTPEAAAKRRPDVRYHAFDLGALAVADRGLLGPMMRDLVAALAKGELRPLPVTVFPLEQASDAFRFMAGAKHVGKIVLRAPAGGRISGDATYLVTGGLGGLGLETARWLVRSGARSLALVGRRAPDAAASGAIAALEREGAKVHVFAADAGDETAMAGVLAALRKPGIPALRGVFHCAGALEDAPLVNQTWDRCRNVLRGKARGAFVLHALTRGLTLDYFVLYSAAGLYLGASGQGAYPAANAELDALAHARHRAGLPALSVGWGAWAEVGMLARLAASGRDPWSARGLLPITLATGFPALERLLRDGTVHALVLPIRWKDFLAQPAPGLDRAFFDAVAPKATEARTAAAKVQTAGGLGAKLRALAPAQRRPALLAELLARAAQVIGLEAGAAIDPRVPLREVGLDSLMSVELRNVLARAVGQPLPATLVFDHPTADALADHLLERLGALPAAEPAPAEPTPKDQRARDQVANLSDAEAEAALLAELGDGGAR
jgi:acyl transferase domain-containing protein/NADPH:quinone reductase-like Zn-dependent oxidoreductase